MSVRNGGLRIPQQSVLPEEGRLEAINRKQRQMKFRHNPSYSKQIRSKYRDLFPSQKEVLARLQDLEQELAKQKMANDDLQKQLLSLHKSPVLKTGKPKRKKLYNSGPKRPAFVSESKRPPSFSQASNKSEQ